MYFPSTLISDLVPISEAYVKEELDSKEKEISWIKKAGKEILPRTEKSEAAKIETKKASDTWDEIVRIWEQRSKRIQEAKKKAKDYTKELNQLRDWMKDLEAKLNPPVTLADTSEKEYKKKSKDYSVRISGEHPS